MNKVEQAAEKGGTWLTVEEALQATGGLPFTQEDRGRATQWLEGNCHLVRHWTLPKILAAYASYVTAEKDAEIERLRADLEMMEAEARGASLYCSICGSCGEEGCGCTHKCAYAFAHPDVSERLAKLETIVEAARDLAKAFKGDPCRFDHHGNCQAHFLEEDCSVERLKKSLTALDGDKADG